MVAAGYEHDPAYTDPLEIERREAIYDRLRIENGWLPLAEGGQ